MKNNFWVLERKSAVSITPFYYGIGINFETSDIHQAIKFFSKEDSERFKHIETDRLLGYESREHCFFDTEDKTND